MAKSEDRHIEDGFSPKFLLHDARDQMMSFSGCTQRACAFNGFHPILERDGGSSQPLTPRFGYCFNSVPIYCAEFIRY
jgi:hypothetical protein